MDCTQCAVHAEEATSIVLHTPGDAAYPRSPIEELKSERTLAAWLLIPMLGGAIISITLLFPLHGSSAVHRSYHRLNSALPKG